jgi:hypothetical protein
MNINPGSKQSGFFFVPCCMHFSAGPFHVEVFDSISQVEAAWNKFNLSSGHLQSSYLSALESADPSDMEFRYVVISRDHKIAACAYLQLVNYSDANFSGQGSAFLIGALKLFFRLKKIRLLFCGNLFSCDFPCLHYIEDEITFENVLQIIKTIQAKEKCQLLMMKEMKVSDPSVQVLKAQGFRKYDEDLTMSLHISPSWKTFDDYLNALTKKYRKRLRLILDAGKKITVRKLGGEEIKAFLPGIGELFSQTAAKQFLKMGIIRENYFLEMQKAFGDRFFINGYFDGQQLIAFASHIIHDEMLEVHYIGINYSLNNKYSLYFNILYEGVRQAIGMKKKILELGRTAREAKASVGCKPMPSYDYLFVSNRLINFLITVFEKLFLERMGDEWKNRHPFKQTVPA